MRTTNAKLTVKIEPAMDRLYRAVAAYVKSRGGNVAVIGGIEIQKWPGESEFHFRVAVRCTGKRPLREASDGE